MTAARPVPAIPAASVVLIRDGAAGLEVLLVERHPHAGFAPGATVFPGGKVDAADAGQAVRSCCRGLDGLDDEAAALRVAGIRELFEECGILLARARGESALLGHVRTSELARHHRRELETGRLAMAGLAAREELELAADLLVPFAHWITPEPSPRRFDTHFFLAAAPGDQAAVFEPGESVDLTWLSPDAALAEAEQGRSTLMLPTRMNLLKLGRSASVAVALETARGSCVVPVLPRIEATPDGPKLRLPPEAGYDVVEMSLEDLRRKRS
jgi:8-oxo-dGTP pyrophosphatase MutT (NUDIX family)